MTGSTVSASELAARVRAASHVRCDVALASRFLAEWLASGVVEETLPGRFRLSARGRAMFEGWASVLELADDGDQAEVAA